MNSLVVDCVTGASRVVVLSSAEVAARERDIVLARRGDRGEYVIGSNRAQISGDGVDTAIVTIVFPALEGDKVIDVLVNGVAFSVVGGAVVNGVVSGELEIVSDAPGTVISVRPALVDLAISIEVI